MSKEIDPNFRPANYFRPIELRRHLISQVKGAAVRTRLERLLDEGRSEELDALLGDTGVLDDIEKGLESVDPSFMGGNYLADLQEGEVEVARVETASATSDVISLYAKRVGGRYIFRIVDEYEGDTLTGETIMEAEQPLKLSEMADFFLSGWSLIEVLEMNNFQQDIYAALGFFVAKSDFYPQFHEYCVELVMAAFPQSEQEKEPE